jgi:arylsulfatase A-like enzyme
MLGSHLFEAADHVSHVVFRHPAQSLCHEGFTLARPASYALIELQKGYVMQSRRDFLRNAAIGLTALAMSGPARVLTGGTRQKPNVLFILVDDMGYADPSCYGNTKIKTPNIDRLADEGIRFQQFYVNSPLCSPTRVAFTTGQYPGRWRINSYLCNRQSNRNRKMADFLDPKAPSLARQLKTAGYVSAHFGKWHMGGGRDVDDAPHPQAYGFGESSVTFEGLGERLLIRNDHLSRLSAQLGQGGVTWVEKREITGIRVDQTLDFIRRHTDKPFYIHLWLNDVHDPFIPTPEQVNEFRNVTDNPYEQQFFAVLDEMDRQIGRLLKGLSEMEMDEKTLIIFTSDNGPTDWPHYYRKGHLPPGDVGPLRGRKWSLYEGGIRMPFIARWKGAIPAGRVDHTTVASGIDLFPTLCKLAGAPLPTHTHLDGIDIAGALFGTPIVRETPLFWYYPNTPRPGKDEHVSPMLAIRHGNWKLLCNPDRGDLQLYNLAEDIAETTNLAEDNPAIASSLKSEVLAWYRSLPTV